MSLPYIFSPGTIIYSAESNSNGTYLTTMIDHNGTTSKIRVNTTTGNVGFNGDPNYNVHVFGANARMQVEYVGQSAISLSAASSSETILAYSAGAGTAGLSVQNGVSANIMKFQGNGFVAVGQGTATQNLHVFGTNSVIQVEYVGQSSMSMQALTTSETVLQYNSGSGTPGLTVKTGGGSAVMKFQGNALVAVGSGTATSNVHIFGTNALFTVEYSGQSSITLKAASSSEVELTYNSGSGTSGLTVKNGSGTGIMKYYGNGGTAILGGNVFYCNDSSNTKTLNFQHNGTNGIISVTSGDLKLLPASASNNVIIGNGSKVLLYDSGGTKIVYLGHDGSSFVNYVSSGGWYFESGTSTPSCIFATGVIMGIRDTSNTKELVFKHDGTNAVISVTSGLLLVKAYLYVQDGASIAAFATGNTKSISMFHDGTNGVLGSNSGGIFINPTGGSNAGPYSDNTFSWGQSGLRFTAVWAVNGTIQTSDFRLKKDIQNSDLGLEFINALRPVSFRWKDKEDDKKYYGLIAQELENVLNGREFDGLVHDKNTDHYGLNYASLIAPLIRAFQEQNEEVQELRELVTASLR